MKTIFKFFGTILSSIIILVSCLCALLGTEWYVYTDFHNHAWGDAIIKLFSETGIFVILLTSVVLLLVFSFLIKAFNDCIHYRLRNFYIHIITWFICIVAISTSILVFAIAPNMTTRSISMTLRRKLGIGVCALLLIINYLLAPKIRKVLQRRLTAFDTANELEMKGRSSVFWINFWKAIDILFPEIVVLALLCFCFDISISVYFIVCIVACFIPVFGNMLADYNSKKYAIAKKVAEDRKLVVDIANEIEDRQNGAV